jgi:hypothetical protein
MKKIKSPLWAVILLHFIGLVFVVFGIYDKELMAIVLGLLPIVGFWIGTLTSK